DAGEGTVAAPAVVRLAGGPVETEGDVRHRGPMLDEERPDALEMPSVGDETARQLQLAERRENVAEPAVQRGLAAGEHDVFDAHRVPRLAGDAGDEVHREKIRRTVVQR